MSKKFWRQYLDPVHYHGSAILYMHAIFEAIKYIEHYRQQHPPGDNYVAPVIVLESGRCNLMDKHRTEKPEQAAHVRF